MLRYLLSLSIVIFLGACVTSKDQQVSTAGSELALPIPDGYCQLSDSHPADRRMIETMRQLNVNNNRVLSVFAVCGDLERYRKVGGQIDRTGTYFAPKSADGKHISTPRPKFVQQIAKHVGRADLMANANRQAQKAVRESGTNLKLEEKVTRLIHTDENAAYLGTLQTWELADGQKQTTSVVTGLTVVQGKVVSLNLFMPHQDESTTRVLLAQTQKNVRRLVDANGG